VTISGLDLIKVIIIGLYYWSCTVHTELNKVYTQNLIKRTQKLNIKR